MHTAGQEIVDLEAQSHVDEADRRNAALMVAAQAGDRTAYEILLHQCIPFIKMVARRHRVPPDAVDDVVQETLLTIHRARHTYDPTRSFTAWLRTIAQRRVVDVLRILGRRGAREVHAPLPYENHPDPHENSEAAIERADRTVVLHRAIAILPVRQREAVEHLALREQSLAEASAATGRTTGSLKVNIHRALKSLRAQLGREDRRP